MLGTHAWIPQLPLKRCGVQHVQHFLPGSVLLGLVADPSGAVGSARRCTARVIRIDL